MTTFEQVINQVRDILRREGITGIPSANHCIFFTLSRFLTLEKCIRFGIDQQYCFEKLLECESDTLLFEKVYNGSPDCLVGEVINKLHYTNIKGNFKIRNIHNLRQIIKLFSTINLDNYTSTNDIIGLLFESHLGTGSSGTGMRDLGQFFTPRNVIRYMVELCQPKKDDIILDGSCGTGGFLAMSVKHLNNQYPNLDWSQLQHRVYGFDIDDEVHNMARVNLLLETGYKFDNIFKRDTLNEGLVDDNGCEMPKADVQLINEPMGIKGLKFADCCKAIKDLKISGTKAEPLFLQLFMQNLNKDGRCAIVVPDGMLFNDSNQHKSTRKYLVEHFELKKVVQIQSGAFLNTGVKTSILFFSNTERTKEVEFCQLEMSERGQLVEKLIVKIDFDQIKQNQYSLFVNKYTTEQVEKIEGIQYKKLGELIISSNSGEVISKDYWNSGTHILYTCCQNYVKTNYDTFPVNKLTTDGDLLLPRNGSGIPYVKIPIEGSLYTNVVQRIKLNSDICNHKYICYYINANINEIIKNVNIGTIPSYNFELWKNFEIPIPDISIQNKIVQQIEAINQNTEISRQLIESNKTKMKNYLELQLNMHQVQTVKLGDVCEHIKTGKNKPSDNKTGTLYPYFGTGGINGYTDEYLFDGKYMMTPRNGTVGSITKYDGKFFPSDHMYVLKIKNNINFDYVYHFLNELNDFDNHKRGTTIPNITTENLKNFKMSIPTVDIQQKIVEFLDCLSNLNILLEKQIENNHQMVTDIMNAYLNDKKPIDCDQTSDNQVQDEVSPAKTELRSDLECSPKIDETLPKTNVVPKTKQPLTKKPTPKPKSTKTNSPTNTCQSINQRTKQPCKLKPALNQIYCKKHLPKVDSDLLIDDEVVDD